MLAFATNTVSITDSNVRLTGTGSLSVSNGNEDDLITFSVGGPGASLLIDSTTLIVDGPFFQNAQCDANLVINHSTVKAGGTAFKQITLNDCYLSEPEGAFVGSGENQVGTYQGISGQDGKIAKSYTILPGSITMYPIEVNGVQVSSSMGCFGQTSTLLCHPA